jgi:hypothetical protein
MSNGLKMSLGHLAAYELVYAAMGGRSASPR